MPKFKLNVDPKSDYVQQGDVIVTDVKALPKGLKARKDSRVILAHGEVTGHCHEVVDPTKVDFYEDEKGTLWLDVHEEVELTHQEHGTITLEPGVKRIGRVREQDPFEDIVRQVAD